MDDGTGAGLYIPGRDEITARFVDRFRPAEVLDVGCGAGTAWPIFRAAGVRITGIDILPPESVPASGDSCSYVRGDFMSHDFGRKFDAVFSSHMVEHVQDTASFLRRFFDLLRPGGSFCLIWPPPKPNVVGGHVHVFNVGLMLYNIVRLGISCREAATFRSGYSLGVMGPGRRFQVPELNFGLGEIERLAAWFPFPAAQDFDGDDVPGLAEIPITRFPAAALAVAHEGLRRGDAIVSDPALRGGLGIADDLISYGPYVRLGAGRHRVGLVGDADPAGAVAVHLTSDAGRRTWVRTDLGCFERAGGSFSFEVVLPLRVENFEVVLRHRAPGTFRLTELRIETQ